MNDQEKIMSVLAQGYQLLSKAMKQQPSKEGFQQVLQMLGDDGIQACVQVAEQGPEAVAQTMVQVIQEKQTQKAARGAKLNRIKALNNTCPEGYMKKGGKCKKCEKGKKLDTTKGVFNVTAYFKDGGINKMQSGKNNPKSTTIISKYKKSPGYSNQIDYVKYGDGRVYERNIDVTPNGNDTIYNYWGPNMEKPVVSFKSTKPAFDRAYNQVQPKDRAVKTANIISIPFFRH